MIAINRGGLNSHGSCPDLSIDMENSRGATDQKTHGSDRFSDQGHGSDHFSDQQKKKKFPPK